MSIETTRRSLLAAIPAVAAVASIPAAASVTKGNDAEILAAFERWSEARQTWNSLPPEVDPVIEANGYTARENHFHGIIVEAERLIENATATTLEGVAIQIWLMIDNTHVDRDDCEAIQRRDLAYFERCRGALDADASFGVAALRSLQAIQSN